MTTPTILVEKFYNNLDAKKKYEKLLIDVVLKEYREK
jgi:hypothetical protein